MHICRDNILTQPNGSTSTHKATEFTERDATAAILLLDTLGYDILLFGWWENGELRAIDRKSKSKGTEV
jgi:hypothetical protein